MPGIEKRNFESPDEVRPAGTGEGRIVSLGGLAWGKGTLPPGWRWSKDVKPITKTDSCQAPHLLYVISGRMHVVLNDGSEDEFGPGDLGLIPPGHDAWVVGNQPLVNIDI